MHILQRGRRRGSGDISKKAPSYLIAKAVVISKILFARIRDEE